jgi:raffinose/stachyose/melibiose transport system permease protein
LLKERDMQKILRNKLAILVFVLPALLLFTVVVTYPILLTVYRSFFAWDGLNPPEYIGMTNYRNLFRDSDFYISLKNSLIFGGIITVYQIGLGTLLAVFINNKRVKGSRILRSGFFLPVVMSITVVCQLWISIYDGHRGLLNKIFEYMGLSYRQGWLGGFNTTIVAIAFVNAWQFMGYHMIILYAAIKSIPDHYQEAAAIDGASPARAFFNILLPMLQETYKICFIFTITGGIKAFEHIYVMTRGGPGTSSFTLTMLLYKSVINLGKYGYGCSSATILLLECIIVMVVINKVIARERVTY